MADDYSRFKKYDDAWKRKQMASLTPQEMMDRDILDIIDRRNHLARKGDYYTAENAKGDTGAGARPYWPTPSLDSGNFNPRYLNKLPIDQTPTNFQDIPRQPLLNIDRDRPRIPPAAYKPDERPWYFNPSWEGVKDAGREVMRQGEGFLGGVNNYFKKLFNDPARLAQIQTSLALMNPSLRYDQGPKGLEVDNPWGAFGKAMQVGQKSYMDAINRPMRYTTNSFGQVIDKMTGRVMANQGGAGNMPLDGRQTFFYNEMKESNPNLTPADIKFNRVRIPTELISKYAEMTRANFNMNTTYPQEYMKKQAGEDVKDVKAISARADTAFQSNSELDSQLAILNNKNNSELFGSFADEREWFREFGSLLGMDFNDEITTYQIFAKSSMKQLLNELKEQKGPQTEGDALRAMRTLPKMDNTVLANKYILLMRKAINQRAIAKNDLLQRHLAEGDGTPRGFQQKWYKSPEAKLSIFERMNELDPDVLFDLVDAGVMDQKTLEQIFANIDKE